MSDRTRIAGVASLLAAFVFAAHTAAAAEPDWIKQFGSEPSDAGSDFARAVATGPNGTVYVVGWAAGSLGGPNKGNDDAFIITFDGDGNEVWKRQPGTALHTGADGVTTDAAGNVYLAGSYDAFLVKFAPDGRILWRRQPPLATIANARAVATDPDGNVYVAGMTLSSFGGPNKGDTDVFLIKFAADGRRLWSRQPGTSKSDYAGGVATDRDGDGNVYVTGLTGGALGGTYKGT